MVGNSNDDNDNNNSGDNNSTDQEGFSTRELFAVDSPTVNTTYAPNPNRLSVVM